MSTFLGHIFSANALQNNEFYPNVEDVDRDLKPAFWNILDFFVVDGSRYVLRPENRLETCEFKSKQDVNSMWMEAGALSCENIYSRLVDFSHNVWYDKRLGLNFVQPQVIRAYSEVGFEHRYQKLGWQNNIEKCDMLTCDLHY